MNSENRCPVRVGAAPNRLVALDRDKRRARQYQSIARCRGAVDFRDQGPATVARSSAVASCPDEGAHGMAERQVIAIVDDDALIRETLKGLVD